MKELPWIVAGVAIAAVAYVALRPSPPAKASSSTASAAAGLIGFLSGNDTANRVGVSLLTKLGVY